MQTLCGRIKGLFDDICGEDVCGVGIRVAQIVGETDSREGVVVAVACGVELHHRDGAALKWHGALRQFRGAISG